MKLWKRSAGLWAGLLGAASLLGCTLQAGVSPGPPPPPPDVTGSVTIRWTIAGSDSPVQCAYYAVDNLKLDIHDDTGASVTSIEASCEAFNVTVDLDPGTYNADATLVDVNDKPTSLSLPIDDIKVTTGTDLAIDIDFPARSML
jgi:hypothetical protein